MSSINSIEVKILEPLEEPELLDFMLTHLPEGERFQTFWQWRKKGPLPTASESAAIARLNGRIEGCVGIVPVYLASGGQKIHAQWQQDSLVAEPLRGRGIGKKLVQTGWQNFELSMAKGTSDAMYRLRISAGYRDVPNSDYLVRLLKARPLTAGLKTVFFEKVLSIVVGLFPRPAIDPGIVVRTIERFDESYGRLAESVSAMDILGPVKDRDYLNWRYFDCPGKNYQVFQAEGDGVLGAIVLNITGSDKEEGWVVDLVADPGGKAVAYALISRAMDYFKMQGVKRIYTFATLSVARKWFLRFGFLPTGRSPRFTCRFASEEMKALSPERCEWNFWHGDGDVELYM